ncbi:hypothetical protein C0J50_15495 [Silurus asotus]|uniref:Uncharacterized protein n=1 Tax=Silurus asotus TaxID=30991 RepID=A0AAD5FQR3_SILAS|nr:hypothetical protein C0J50_15495 [Silurus asotus]
MTTTGIFNQQGTGGNWATVGRRTRKKTSIETAGKEEVEVQVGTLNVCLMTGKGRAVAEKEIKARNFRGGFKLFYHGVDEKQNGVGVILKEEYSKTVVDIEFMIVLTVKLEVEAVMINVISAYAPQVGCEMDVKEKFSSKLDEVVESVPKKKRLLIGADMFIHVGEGNRGDG